MNTNTDLLLNFIFTIAFTILIFAVLKLSKDNKTMRAEIDELRVLFNQKFLQEMAVNKPVVRFEFLKNWISVIGSTDDLISRVP